MRWLSHKEIDTGKWDKVVEQSDSPWVFAQSFWLNAVCPEWRALVSEDGKSVFPVTAMSKFGIRYVIQPPFTPQLGLFGKMNEELFKDCIKNIRSGYRYASIEINHFNLLFHPTAKRKRTYVIDLQKEFKYNSNTKRNIAKTAKSQLNVRVLESEEVMPLTKKYLEPFMKNKLKLSAAHIRNFRQLLLNALQEEKLYSIVTQDKDGTILAIAHFIYNSRHAVYLKGTNFEKELGSMHLLMDHAIHFFKQRKNEVFDFGGGQSSSLAQFYSGFGASPLEYGILSYNELPKPIKWLKRQ